MTETELFNDWLKHHGCTAEELWKIQNCILSVLGEDHPFAIAATKAWLETRFISNNEAK